VTALSNCQRNHMTSENLRMQQGLEDVAHLIKQWGIVHSREFTWRPDTNSKITVRSARHPTAEAADRDAREQALAFGYQPPKLWQFWRWGEYPLPSVDKPGQNG